MKHVVISTLFLFVAIAAVNLSAQPLIPKAPVLEAEAWILMDAKTGKVLAQSNADVQLEPASLTKLMTAYIVSDEINSNRLNNDDDVMVSVNAWRKGGAKSGSSTMYLPPEKKAKVIDLLYGLIVQSGGDAAIALAEHISGSEESFVDVMNQQATLLGMTNTHFVNASGWPNAAHLSSARDLAILSVAVIEKHPEQYGIYSEKEFTYNGIKQPNRNNLLWRDASIDGLKTGRTDSAGYSLAASGVRNGMRLVSVVLGAKNERVRTSETQRLLSWGFRYFTTHQLYEKGEVLTINKIWKAKQAKVDIGINKEIFLTIPRGSEDLLEAEMNLPSMLSAPLEMGEIVGDLTIKYEGEEIVSSPLVVQSQVDTASFFSRLWDSLKLFLLSIFGSDSE